MENKPKILLGTNLLGGHSWLFIVIQAVAAILIGGLFLFIPYGAMLTLALTLGVMLLGCGIQGIILMVLAKKAAISSIFYTLILLTAGAFLVIDPLLGAMELLLILGIWFLFHAVELFVGTIRARTLPTAFRLMAGFNGLLSLIFGILIIRYPLGSTVWVGYVFTFYLILYGLVTLTVGLRLKSLQNNNGETAGKN